MKSKPTKKARAVARKPKVEPWRAELARIVKFLNNLQSDKRETPEYGQARNLWAVLSALRGPDFEEKYPYPVKHAITGVLRNQVGLLPLSIAYVNVEDCADRAAFRAEYEEDNDHFYDHARAAFDALGLKWSEVNEARK